MVILLIIFAILVTVLISHYTRKTPKIDTIWPLTSKSGDIITIQGDNFGLARSDSYVDIGGNRLSASAYTSWTNEQITFVVPRNTNNALLYVVTPAGRSEPMIFTNQDSIPVPVPPDPITSIPVISSISQTKSEIGDVITLSGNNFGSLRNNSQVIFTGKSHAISNQEWIPCSEFDQDYILWSDQEISVKVPDGAETGFLYVQTPKGISNKLRLEITRSNGYKNYTNEHTYIVSANVDLTDIETSNLAAITMFIPYPPLSSWQRSVSISEVKPEPSIQKYGNTIVHQTQILKGTNLSNQKKIEFKNTFVITVKAVETIISKYVNTFADTYTPYTLPDEIVPSNNDSIKILGTKIIGRERNQATKAKLIYNYILKNLTLLQDNRPSDADVIDVLETGYGDAYDFAILFTALCRSVGIPTLPVSGVLVDVNLKARNHWWSEFYLQGIGWIPVDPSMGAGLEYEIFQPQEKPAEYYFGSLDSQHITFSRGWNSIKNAQQSERKVYYPKTYALQSFWEETTEDTLRYSSYWTPITILGVY